MTIDNRDRAMRLVAAIGLLLVIGGCATTPGEEADPLEGVNRGIYGFNDYLDVNFVKPVAEGYVEVTPAPVRSVVTNFFDNLGYLNVILNDVLQGKLLQSVQDSSRFVVNSTIGVLGMFDVATAMGLDAHDEDLGQSFGVWGLGEGAYLMVPLGGPSSVRDAPGLLVSRLLNPLFYASASLSIPLGLINAVNTRANLLDASEFRDEAALDPYVFTREAYRQSRIYAIHDGSPPSEDLDDFMEEELDDLEGFDDELLEEDAGGELLIE